MWPPKSFTHIFYKNESISSKKNGSSHFIPLTSQRGWMSILYDIDDVSSTMEMKINWQLLCYMKLYSTIIVIFLCLLVLDYLHSRFFYKYINKKFTPLYTFKNNVTLHIQNFRWDLTYHVLLGASQILCINNVETPFSFPKWERH